MKIAILGVGSFVFGPSVLHDAIVEHQFQGMHLALFDPNRQAMELMARVGEQMAREVNLSVRITCHDSQVEAIDSADFVVSAAAVQLQKRFGIDCEIIRKIYPEHLVTEFGGVSGISYTLRQIPLMRGLARDMLKHCPKAWLLTSANPLPRVCQAVHEDGVKVAGFCSNSAQVLGAVGQVMLGVSEQFPWPVASARYEVEMAGVNHFTWVVGLQDKTAGRDVTREFMERVAKGDGGIASSRPMTFAMMRDLGLYPPNGDTHMADFVRPTGQVQSLESSSHGTAQEREARLKLLEDVGAGRADYRLAMDHRAWEMPMDFVAAIAESAEVRFQSLNLINEGQLPQLPRNVFVETSVTSKGGRILPTQQALPARIAQACTATAMVHSTLVAAAREKSRARLAEAVELDPTIVDKKLGTAALNACMETHADLIGKW